ncbi:Phospholipase A and acyltransferase 1 [Bulinus truncatus]|nr:Phospholipase A and acyltransferase 1 [Bulinus truncatus]
MILEYVRVSQRQKVVDRVTLYAPLNMNDSTQLGGKQILTSDEADFKRHIPSRGLDMEDLTERRNYPHNSRTLNDLKEGDRVEIKRYFFLFTLGHLCDGKVVHLVGVGVNGLDQRVRPDVLFKISGKIFSKAKVCRDDFWDVVREHQANVNNCDYLRCILPTDEIIKRANGSVGYVGYNVIYNNCEHFATWCRYDKVESRQINRCVNQLRVSVLLSVISQNYIEKLTSTIFKNNHIFRRIYLRILLFASIYDFNTLTRSNEYKKLIMNDIQPSSQSASEDQNLD